jgi:hypothetical protein
VAITVTQEQLDILVANYFKGIKSASADGLKQDFQTMEDMWKAILRAEAILGSPTSHRLLTSRKGLGTGYGNGSGGWGY